MLGNGPIRVLVVEDQRLVVELVKLTLNHGVYVTREARDAVTAATVLAEWQPHLAVVDMDLGDDQLLRRIGGVGLRPGARVPTIALTRRGDLKNKLAAFDQGVDEGIFTRLNQQKLPGCYLHRSNPNDVARSEHLTFGPSGVRAQALGPSGALVDDFVISCSGRVAHVLNAPSPAATSSLVVSRMIMDQVGEWFQ